MNHINSKKILFLILINLIFLKEKFLNSENIKTNLKEYFLKENSTSNIMIKKNKDN